MSYAYKKLITDICLVPFLDRMEFNDLYGKYFKIIYYNMFS